MTRPERYTKVAISLHWIIAVMILINLCLPTIWEYVSDAQVRPLINLHKSFGVSIFGFVLIRILWRLTHPAPAMPRHYARWEVILASAVHGLLYLLMLGVPLTGYIMDSAWKHAAENPLMLFGLFEVPHIKALLTMDAAQREVIHHLFESRHEAAAWALFGLIVLHVVGALKHQFLDREPELQRMMFR